MTATCATCEILPARLRQAVPWKNGGGITREIAAAPPGAALGDFDWRVSTAEVSRPGPFSLFAGVDRKLCVLEGELLLTLGADAVEVLAAHSAPCAFAGDVAAHAIPLSASVTDLNVMTRRDRFAAEVSRVQVTGGAALGLGHETTLIFALADLELEVSGRSLPLARWDAARCTGPGSCRVSATSLPAALWRIEICAVRGRGALR